MNVISSILNQKNNLGNNNIVKSAYFQIEYAGFAFIVSFDI